MKIRSKLTTSMMVVVLTLISASTLIDQNQLENVIYRNYEQKGIDAATLTYKLSFQRLAEITKNYTNFLANDSKVVSATQNLIADINTPESTSVFIDHISQLNLSFIEVTDLTGRVRYTSLNTKHNTYNLLAPMVSSAREGLQLTRLSYEDKNKQFFIHSTALISNNGSPVGVLHSGYILEESLLKSLAVDYGLLIYDSNSHVVSTNTIGPSPLDRSFISNIYSDAVSYCFNSLPKDCSKIFIASSYQTVNDNDYLYTAMPVSLNNDLPVATIVVSHEMSIIQRELSNALRNDVFLFIGLALFALLLSFYISRLLASPLVRLTNLVQQYSSGDTVNFSSVKRDTYEVDSLVTAIREMITEREAAEFARDESEEQVSLLLKSTGEAILGINKEGLCTFANPACLRILGLSNEDQLVGHNVFELILDEKEYLAAAKYLNHSHTTGQPLSTEDVMLKRFDIDDNFPAELHLSPVFRFQQLVGSVITFNDISERKSIERIRQRLNEDLEEQVSIRTQELETSLKQLQETQSQLVQSEKMASLGNLVAGIAHEINTPIGVGITASSHLEDVVERYLHDYKEGKLTKSHFEKFMLEARDTSHLVAINLLRAGELIRSFKQVAVDQSSNNDRPFFITPYINDIIRSLQPNMRNTKTVINITGDKDLEIYSVPGLYSQIFTNLIMNSLIHGFTPDKEGIIDIEISMQDHNLHITYRDNGKGMEQTMLNNIFEPFATTKRSSGGTGLGMHVVYNVVTQGLNGKIRCFSKEDVGTSFVIDIPIKAFSQQPSTPA